MVGTTLIKSLHENLILERKIEELDMDRIAYHLCIYVFESCINTGADELQVGEVIFCSHQDLKAHMVATNCEGVYFGGFVCPYNILTRIQQRLNGKETLSEVFNHNKGLAGLNMSEYEAITVYTLFIASPVFLGVKNTPSQTSGLCLTAPSDITSVCRQV